MDFTDECTSLQKGEPIVLGILGSRNDCTQQQLIESVWNPILSTLGRTPDQMVLPEEGTTTIYLSDWADSLHIPTKLYDCDWKKHQRRAKILRDARIQQESTHLLVFCNKRSQANEQIAIRMARKGKRVFTVSWKDWCVEELEIEPMTFIASELPSSIQQSAHPTMHGNKRGIGRETMSSKLQPIKGLGIQSQLPYSWGVCTQK
jgi:hypothetical protein